MTPESSCNRLQCLGALGSRAASKVQQSEADRSCQQENAPKLQAQDVHAVSRIPLATMKFTSFAVRQRGALSVNGGVKKTVKLNTHVHFEV